MLRRYLLFAGRNQYQAGGWDDFAGSYATAEEALDQLTFMQKDWFQIVDTETGYVQTTQD